MTDAQAALILAALGNGAAAPDLRPALGPLRLCAAYRRPFAAAVRAGRQDGAALHPPADRGLGATRKGFRRADLAKGEPTIVNFWASWCVPCHEEHPLLWNCQAARRRLYGINYKDDAASARRFLGRYGNPFGRGRRPPGRVAIDWGVYGMPETYVLNGEGEIAFRHVGPLTEDAIKEKLLPLVQPTGAKPQG